MKNARPTGVLLANDQPVVSDCLRSILAEQPDIRVVGEATNGSAAVEEARRLKPDVVLMDLAHQEAGNITAARQIRKDCPATQVVVLSDRANEEIIFRALNAGALGYVLKKPAGHEMTEAIRSARAGRRYLSARVADIVIGNFVRQRRPAQAASPLASLSRREQEVLGLVVEGRSSKEIAARMHLAASTVDTYRSRIMTKLGVKSLADLVKFAMLHGLTEPAGE